MHDVKRHPWYRLHLTSYFLLTLVAAAMAVINLPFKYVEPEAGSSNEVRLAGWPLRYGEVRSHDDEVFAVNRWSWLALLVDVGLAVGLLATSTALNEWRRRRRTRLWQVTLADVFVVILVVSGLLAVWRAQVARYEQQQAVIYRIRNSGGTVSSQLLLPQVLVGDGPSAVPPRPHSWRERVIEQLYFFEQPIQARIPWHNGPGILSSVGGFTELQTLVVEAGATRKGDLVALPRLKHLRQLSLNGKEITDEDVEFIVQLSELRRLRVCGTSVTDDGIARITHKLPLVSLDVEGMPITDEGLSHIACISTLETLNINNTSVTADGLVSLHGHPTLTSLWLGNSDESDNDELRKVVLKDMPRLRDVHLPAPLAVLHLERLPSLEKIPSSPNSSDWTGDIWGYNNHWSSPNSSTGDIWGYNNHWRRFVWQGNRVAAERVVLRDLPRLESLMLDPKPLRHLALDGLDGLQLLSLMSATRGRKQDLGFEITDAIADSMGRQTSLLSLNIVGARLSPKGWSSFAGLTNLKSLDLSASNISDADVKHFANIPLLEELSFAKTDVGDDGWQQLPRLPNLQRLSLSRTKISDLELDGLKDLVFLDVFNTPINRLRLVDLPKLESEFRLNSQHIESLRLIDLPKLHWFSIEGATVEHVSLRGLSSLGHLGLSATNAQDNWLVDISNWKMLSAILLRDIQITDDMLVEIGKLDGVERLDLENTAVTDAGLVHLDLAALEVFNLTGTAITDQGLKYLSKSHNLELLYLGRTQVKGPGLEHLTNLPALRKLSLGVTQVDSKSLAALRGMTCLEWLRLSDTTVDDRAFSHLNELSSLRYLFLNGTSITDEGFSQFGAPRALKELDVRNTVISDGAIRRLKQKRPRLQISWDNE